MALAEFLPLNKENWITHGNALRLDWLKVCPPTGTGGVKLVEDDLFQTPLDQIVIDFENEGGETYICGNPPYAGSTWQIASQKADMDNVFKGRTRTWKTLDYVSGWFVKAMDYGNDAEIAFVATNSICQGQQVPILWTILFKSGYRIRFAYPSFQWSNLASHNAGVTVIIVGLSKRVDDRPKMFVVERDQCSEKTVENINAYLVAGPSVVVDKRSDVLSGLAEMDAGSKPVDGGYLFLDFDQRTALLQQDGDASNYVREFSSSQEFINGKMRYCLWINDQDVDHAKQIDEISHRLKQITEVRSASTKADTRRLASFPHRFGQNRHHESEKTIVIPRVSSEARPFLPVGLVPGRTIVGDRQFAMYEGSTFYIALIASRLHWVWIGAVCVRMRTDLSYSNVLGWNTFPVPELTDVNNADLARCAEDILLTRESHWPATIAELYDPETMPLDLRAVHDRNDETLERIYIGRRFKNDTERLETLFQLYTEMTGERN